jgi:hypothetical protein
VLGQLNSRYKAPKHMINITFWKYIAQIIINFMFMLLIEEANKILEINRTSGFHVSCNNTVMILNQLVRKLLWSTQTDRQTGRNSNSLVRHDIAQDCRTLHIFFRVCPNINSKIHAITIFNSIVKKKQYMNTTCPCPRPLIVTELICLKSTIR